MVGLQPLQLEVADRADIRESVSNAWSKFSAFGDMLDHMCIYSVYIII